jgi:hypothetical protein
MVQSKDYSYESDTERREEKQTSTQDHLITSLRILSWNAISEQTGSINAAPRHPQTIDTPHLQDETVTPASPSSNSFLRLRRIELTPGGLWSVDDEKSE